MAKGINKFKEWIGIGDEFEEDFEEDIDEQDQEEPEEDEKIEKQGRKAKKITGSASYSVSRKNAYDATLVVLKPQTFEDSKDISDKLKQRKGVYVNLEGIDKVLAQRIVDFIGGSVYALEGNIKKVASAGFIVVPDNISISAEVDERSEGSEENYSWMK